MRDKNKKFKFTDEILNWWETNRRDFPWRHTDDPYTTLITEILLRKTTSGHVNSIHEKFFTLYPSIDELANSDKDKLKKLIKPLGLSNQRSEQLKKLAITLKKEYGGKVPSNCIELMKLPGVGMYTGAGVMCISFKKDNAMVDTNAVKIIERYFGYKTKKTVPYNDPNLWKFVKSLIPNGKCKEFNLGLIDFVSAVCTTKRPKHEICPLKSYCTFYENNEKLYNAHPS